MKSGKCHHKHANMGKLLIQTYFKYNMNIVRDQIQKAHISQKLIDCVVHCSVSTKRQRLE